MTYCSSTSDPVRTGHLASPDGNLGDVLVMRCGIEIPFPELIESSQAPRACPACRAAAEDEDEDY